MKVKSNCMANTLSAKYIHPLSVADTVDTRGALYRTNIGGIFVLFKKERICEHSPLYAFIFGHMLPRTQNLGPEEQSKSNL